MEAKSLGTAMGLVNVAQMISLSLGSLLEGTIHDFTKQYGAGYFWVNIISNQI